MNVLSRYLRTLCAKPLVSYHPKCSRLKLNHLVFADDLMIFIRGDVPSVAAVKSTLSLFAELSGLHANIEKTNMYFGGVPHDVKEAILAATGFSDVFLNLLPKEVLQKINKLCKDFFWGILPEGRRMVFKKWKDICLPWDAEGFNIKDLSTWNDALQCRWIYLLANTTEGSWVSWHQDYILQHQSIWFVQSQDSFSSSLKGILAVRDRLVALAGSITNASSLINGWCSQGKFRVTAAYSYLRGVVLAGPWTAALSHPRIVPSHKIIFSLAAQQKLATVDNLQSRGFYMLLQWMGMHRASSCLLAELEQANLGSKHNWRMAWFCTSLAAAVYQIWNERNSRLFRGRKAAVTKIVSRVKFLVSTRLLMWTSHKQYSLLAASL
ncbi:uncharacterized protein LOC141601325 [Silene latifolia]|uniref:uncharacterized protein LOC141601325 n=1 Tax=Silene latifolia TaxID=37657 RepID=UPI003D77E178